MKYEGYVYEKCFQCGERHDTSSTCATNPKPSRPPEVWPEGRKDDAAKVRMDLIPPELLTAVGDILTFGAGKYGERNWERGMSWGRPFAALMRHMWAWWSGEKADPETGRSHLWHAGCCIAFLIAYEERGVGVDDRPKDFGSGT